MLRSVSLRRAFLLSVLGSLTIAAACGGGSDNLPPPPPPPPAPMVDAAPPPSTAPTTAATAAPTKPPAPPVALTPGAASPDPPAPTPTVKITAPQKDQVVAADKAGDFSVKLDVKNWQTAQGSSHVHLILDNKPYKAIYDTKAPVKLSELAGGEALAEGQHVLIAFPSRANHESVKTKDALAVIPFWVGKRGDAKTDATKKPMLVYSRPKGDYKGEMANHVLIDFYVANVTLAEGKEHVHISVTGPGIDKPLEGHVEKFGTPYYLDNLQNGSYAVKIELMDGQNKPVDNGIWSSISRTINVDHDAPAETSPATAHGDHGGGAADAGAPAKDGGAAKPGPGGGAGAAKDAGPKTAPKAAPTTAPTPMPTQTVPMMPTSKP